MYALSTVQDQRLDLQRKHHFFEQPHSIFNHYKSDYIPVLMGDFNTRLYYNQISGLESHIGSSIFSAAIDDHLLPATNMSFMTDLLQDNELCIVSSMRPRPPSQSITHLEISESPPPYTSPTIDSYAVLDHILCRIEHQKLLSSIRSLPHISLPWFHRTKLQLPYFLSPKTPPPRREFTSTEAKLKYTSSALAAFGLSTSQVNQSPPFHIYTGQ